MYPVLQSQTVNDLPPGSWEGWDAMASDFELVADNPAFRMRQAVKIAYQAEVNNLQGLPVLWKEVEQHLTAILLGDITATQLPNTQVDEAVLAQPIILLHERKKRGRRSEYNYLVVLQGQLEEYGEWFTKGQLKAEFPHAWQTMLEDWKTRREGLASGVTKDEAPDVERDTLASNKDSEAAPGVGAGARHVSGYQAQAQLVEDPQASAVQGREFLDNPQQAEWHVQTGNAAYSSPVTFQMPACAIGEVPEVHTAGHVIPAVYDPNHRGWTPLQPLPIDAHTLPPSASWKMDNGRGLGGGLQLPLPTGQQQQPRSMAFDPGRVNSGSRPILGMFNPQTQIAEGIPLSNMPQPLYTKDPGIRPHQRQGFHPLIAANVEYALGVKKGPPSVLAQAPVPIVPMPRPIDGLAVAHHSSPRSQQLEKHGILSSGVRTTPHPPSVPPVSAAIGTRHAGSSLAAPKDAAVAQPAQYMPKDAGKNEAAPHSAPTKWMQKEGETRSENDGMHATKRRRKEASSSDNQLDDKRAANDLEYTKEQKGGDLRKREEEEEEAPVDEDRLCLSAWKGARIVGAKTIEDAVYVWIRWEGGHKMVVPSHKLIGEDRAHCMISLIKFYESKTKDKKKKEGNGGKEGT